MIKIKPSLVDKSFYKKPVIIPSKPLPLSFYFNIIIVLVLIFGGIGLYYKYITKIDKQDEIKSKLIYLNERINTELKNIE